MLLCEETFKEKNWTISLLYASVFKKRESGTSVVLRVLQEKFQEKELDTFTFLRFKEKFQEKMDPLSCKFFQMYPVKDISFQVSRISSVSLNESFISSDRTRAIYLGSFLA